MRRCSKRGCDLPAGRGFRYCASCILAQRARRSKKKEPEGIRADGTLVTDEWPRGDPDEGFGVTGVDPNRERVDEDSVCYCGWDGVDSNFCACGVSCSQSECDTQASPFSGNLKLCDPCFEQYNEAYFS